MFHLYIVDYFDLFKSNGIATYVDQLTQTLHKYSQINCNYILLRSGEQYREATCVIESGVQYLYIPFEVGSTISDTEAETTVLNFVHQNTLHRKSIIFHFNWINHAPFAFLLKKNIPGCKIVLTKHCIPWRDFIVTNYPLFRHLNKTFVATNSACRFHPALIRERLAYDAVDHIICVTNFAKTALGKMFFILADKLTVIYNGVEINKIRSKNKLALREKYGFSKNEKIILFAASVSTRKGVFDLIKAVARIDVQAKAIRVIIAGSGDFSKLFQSIKKNWANISIVGGIDKKILYDFYQLADIGIAPSYWEQCSYTAIEMMLHGLPIIVSDIEGLAEIVPNDCGLKVRLVLGKSKAYIDAKQLAEKIHYYLDNPAIAKKYATNAQSHAKKSFTARRMATETTAVYEKLISEQKEQTPPLINDDSPLVSVLLPVYDGGKYLGECINSILSQTYSKFELLIVGDDSTEKTSLIIKQYKDKRIVHIKIENSEGIVNSLNKGIALASGKYIARIDTDDMMHPERLQKQVAFLEDVQNKNIAVVGSHHYVIDSIGKMVSFKQYPISNAEVNATLFFHIPFLHPSVMLRAHVLKRYKYTKKYKHAEDYNLWFKIATKHKMANIPEFLTYYRVQETNISKQNNNEQKENVGKLLSMELDKIGVNHTPQELAMSIAMIFGYRQRYFNTHEKVEAAKKWVNKVLISEKNSSVYTPEHLKKMEEYIIESCCGIYL